jgi:hypothetical protein
MIFIGDVASPTAECSSDFYNSIQKSLHIFDHDCVIANLEGLLSDDYYKTNKPLLSNHPSVVEPLTLLNTKVVSLANNHTLDIPQNFNFTKANLSNNNIAICGAGISKQDAEKPARIIHYEQEFLILGYSWNILMQHQKNIPGVMYVNPISQDKILKTIQKLRRSYSKAKIIIKIHWNFDLEIIPFPLHRKFSWAMIDAGADAIIGSHSHCVQGGERYKNGIIIYGLGNFFFPWYIFTSGKSYFPEWTRTEMALQWISETNEVKCHFFRYDYNNKRHELNYLCSEDFDTGELIVKYSPYRNMNHYDYIDWYKKNRRKGFLMPVYRDHEEIMRNKLIDFYLINRIRFARFLAQNNLRGWKR